MEQKHLAEGRCEAGAGNIIELADAEGALLNAKSQQIKAGFDLAVSRARLTQALGAP